MLITHIAAIYLLTVVCRVVQMLCISNSDVSHIRTGAERRRRRRLMRHTAEQKRKLIEHLARSTIVFLFCRRKMTVTLDPHLNPTQQTL